MNASKRLITSLFLAGGIALAAAPTLHAEHEKGHGMGMGMHSEAGKKCPMGGMDRHGGGMMGGMMGGGHDLQPRFLRGLDLTEAQQDKVFDILYPLIPEQRKHHKEARDLRQQQKDLTLSKDYDAGKLKKLVEAEAKSHSEHKLKMAAAHNKIYQLLTDEQKAKVAEKMEQRHH